MQSQPAHLQRKVYWRTLRSSKLHVCLLGGYVVWAVVYVALIILDMHSLWTSIVTIVVIGSMYPFQLIGPKRRLATAFLKLNIRPSHCGYCEYDLQASDGDTCPECGTKLAPKATTETRSN
jgi:hypothetical protein